MPNPTPRPYALNVYVSTPPSGYNYNIAEYINKKSSPIIRFSADGLSSDTTLPLHYVGNLAYAINEWAEIKIEAIDNSEKLFRGYIGQLTSGRLGAERRLNLSCVDGNIKLKRGVGRTVDGGEPGIIPRMHNFAAGTTDRDVIIYLFDHYLPDVDWALVDNVFSLAEPLQVGLCSVYDALVELRKRAPGSAKIRFYCGFRQADWGWQFRWFDVVTLSPSGITLTDDPDPGAGNSNYWTWQRVRNGMPIFNRWYVVGKNPVTGAPVIGGYDDTTSQSDLTVILAGISEDTTKTTIAECEAEAQRILIGKSRARESFTGIETHTPLLLTGPQAIYLKNDLEPGISTPTPFPISSAEFSFPNMIPTYKADLGDRWLALGEEDEGRLYSTPPTRDVTPPAGPTWLTGSTWIVANTYHYNSNSSYITVGWNSNTEGDLLRYRLYYRRYTADDLAQPLPFITNPILINSPNTQYTLEFPTGVRVGFRLEAEDTANNISSSSAVVSTLMAVDPIPQPTSLAIADYGIHHAGNIDTGTPADSMFIKASFSIGAYVPGAGSVFVLQGIATDGSNHTVRAEYDTATALPLYLSGLRLGGVTYNITVWLRNAYNRSGPPATAVSFTTKRLFAPPSMVPWVMKDDRGKIPGYDTVLISKGTWEIKELDGDQGGNAFYAHYTLASGTLALEQKPVGITKGRPLSWAFSVRGRRLTPTGNASGTFVYIIKWCSADLTVLNTQTIKSVVPPSQSVLTQYEGKVDSYSGAVVAIVRLEYSGNTGEEEMWIGLVQLTDQQKPFNMGLRAVLPTAINLLVPGVLQNGSMEQPSLTGLLPEGYDATGTYFYGNDTGTADGFYSVTLGGTVATHTLQTPFIFWTYPIRSTLNYGLRVKWSQYFVNTSGPTRSVWGMFYDSAFTLLGSAKLKANDATTDYVVPITPNPGDCEALLPGSIIPANTAYIQISFQFTTTNSAQLWTIDAIETAPAASPLTANSIQFRSPGGALLSKYTTGPTLPSAPSTKDRHWYTGTDKDVEVYWDGTRWLGPEYQVAIHNYRGAPPFTATEEVLAKSIINAWQLYLTRYIISYYCGGGVDASNYWRVYLRRLHSGIGIDNLVYHQTTSNNWSKPTTDKVAADMANNPLNTSDIWLQVWAEKTLNPNPLYLQIEVFGRLKYT